MTQIISDNIEPTGIIRTAKVLSAREAIGRGAYETPAIFDAALDNMVDRAFAETEMEEARQQLMDEAFDAMCETDR